MSTRPLDQPSHHYSIATKPRTSIVRNIFVWVGICARNSIISLHRYDRANARRRTPHSKGMVERYLVAANPM
jgi:hypothetical protein